MSSEIWMSAMMIGVGATLVMDMAGALRCWRSGQAGLDYRLVGRWLGHMSRGILYQPAIAQATPVRGERLLGWGFHYLTGVVFAFALIVMAGSGWIGAPNPSVPVGFGLLTVAVPFLTLQPCFGLGWAASRTPNPWAARWRSVVTHLSFGVGLYLAGHAFSLSL